MIVSCFGLTSKDIIAIIADCLNDMYLEAAGQVSHLQKKLQFAESTIHALNQQCLALQQPQAYSAVAGDHSSARRGRRSRPY